MSVILADTTPNSTLYLNRLDERIHLNDLRPLLFELCSQFGLVIDVVAGKTLRKKGQAFVVFSEVSSASLALKHLRNATFLGKSLSVAYAKTQSDASEKFEGTYRPKPSSRHRKIGSNAVPMTLELSTA